MTQGQGNPSPQPHFKCSVPAASNLPPLLPPPTPRAGSVLAPASPTPTRSSPSFPIPGQVGHTAFPAHPSASNSQQSCLFFCLAPGVSESHSNREASLITELPEAQLLPFSVLDSWDPRWAPKTSPFPSKAGTRCSAPPRWLLGSEPSPWAGCSPLLLLAPVVAAALSRHPLRFCACRPFRLLLQSSH